MYSGIATFTEAFANSVGGAQKKNDKIKSSKNRRKQKESKPAKEGSDRLRGKSVQSMDTRQCNIKIMFFLETKRRR